MDGEGMSYLFCFCIGLGCGIGGTVWWNHDDPIKKIPDGAYVHSKLNSEYHGLVVRHATEADCQRPQPHQVVCLSVKDRTVNILEDAELELEPEKR